MKLFALIILISGVLSGTTVVPYSENQVIEKSDLIVRGFVESKDTEVGANINRIFTVYKIKVSEFLYPCDKGGGDECINSLNAESVVYDLSEKQNGSFYVTLKTLGGVVGNIGMTVPSSPRFKVSEEKEYLFILKCRDKKEMICKNAEYAVVGFYQGLCDIDDLNGEKILKCSYKDEEGVVSGSSSTSEKTSPRPAKKLKTLKNKLLKRAKSEK